MSIISIPRERDDEILAILAQLARGQSTVAVGAMFGVARAEVSVIRQRVMKADLAASGEPEAIVRAGYGA